MAQAFLCRPAIGGAVYAFRHGVNPMKLSVGAVADRTSRFQEGVALFALACLESGLGSFTLMRGHAERIRHSDTQLRCFLCVVVVSLRVLFCRHGQFLPCSDQRLPDNPNLSDRC